MLEQRGSLAPGTVVGRYEIVSFLGAGGMGQVYVARDSTLDRRVALKILPGDCSPERVLRFQREARAASALNHPSIVTVHDAGTLDGVRFLAMELVDGRPLSDWIRGRRDRRRGILLMAQVAEGLARAHAAGIVHRDIKPDNILVAADYAKIADFGIAKLMAPESDDAAAATDVKTADGEMVGTLAYMSPEQIEGPDVDFRSDVFSFGVVLYEVLTGQSPFRGTSRAETVHAIVHRSPSLDPVPAELRKVVARCLAKDREDRYHSMKDVAHDLRETAAAAPVRTRTLRWVWAALAALAIAGAGWYVLQRNGPAAPPPSVTATRVTNSGQIRATTISPDGKFIAYVARERGLESVWVKQVATGMSTRIAAPSSNRYFKMAISPDANYVYVSMWVRNRETALQQIPILGGDARDVVRYYGSTEFALAPDGHRVVVRQAKEGTYEAQLAVIDIDGGSPRVLLTRPLTSTIYLPAWSPDGKTIAFGSTTFAPVLTRRIETVDVATGKTQTVRTVDWPYVASFSWSPDGRKLLAAAYENEQPPQIWSIPLDGSAPSKITNDLSGYYSVALTADGKSLAALRGEGAASLTLLEMQPDGHAMPVVRGLGNYFVLAGARVLSTIPTHLLSGGGVAWLGNDRLLYTGVTDGLRTILLIPAAGGEPRAVMRRMPAWRPVADEERGRILFLSDQSGNSQVWSCAIDGSSRQQLTTGDQVVTFVATRDSIYYVNGGSERPALRRIPITGGTPETIAPRFVMPMSITKDGRLMIAQAPAGMSASDVNGSNMKLFALPRFGPPVAALDPGGRSITFIDWKDDIANLWSQDLSGGEPRQITSFDRGEIYSFAWSPDGKSIVISQGEPSTDVVLMRNVTY